MLSASGTDPHLHMSWYTVAMNSLRVQQVTFTRPSRIFHFVLRNYILCLFTNQSHKCPDLELCQAISVLSHNRKVSHRLIWRGNWLSRCQGDVRPFWPSERRRSRIACRTIVAFSTESAEGCFPKSVSPFFCCLALR